MLVDGQPFQKNFFPIFSAFFIFFLCRVSALGKAFAECPIKNTRQRPLCRPEFCRVLFAECGTRQRLCRMYLGLCRVFLTLGKASVSRSVQPSWKGQPGNQTCGCLYLEGLVQADQATKAPIVSFISLCSWSRLP